MLAGRSGIAPWSEDWARPCRCGSPAGSRLTLASFLTTREMKRMDRCGQLALVAAREAWVQAGTPGRRPRTVRRGDRLGAMAGTGHQLAQVRELDSGGPRKVSPHTLTRLMVNGPSAWVSIDLGARGGARTPVSACASGAEAIAQGAEMIRSGAADVVIAGGVDACVNDLIISGFSQIRALSTRTTIRSGPRALSTGTATALCWLKAPESWCWRARTTHVPAARKSWGPCRGQQ